MAAMPEAKATALPDSSPPTISSSASHVGVPSSREYSRPLPMMKFEAGIKGTFSGAPGSVERPAETSHVSGVMSSGRSSMLFECLEMKADGEQIDYWSGLRHRS